jgi:hypothetical protein
MFMAAAEGKTKNLYDTDENKPRLRCGDCVYCPTGGKTFCKTARHQTTKATTCNSCKYYKGK